MLALITVKTIHLSKNYPIFLAEHPWACLKSFTEIKWRKQLKIWLHISRNLSVFLCFHIECVS